MHTDGVLELVRNSDESSAFIHAFSADADTTSIGHVFYRETTDSAVLETLVDTVNFGFDPSTLSSVFITTWFYVGYYNNHDDLVSI